MRLLVHFRGRVLSSRGTPLRCRNQVAWLARRRDLEITLLSWDPSAEVGARLGVDHLRIDEPARGAEVLAQAVRERRPDVVYAHTHKGAFDLRRLDPGSAPARVADLHGDPAWEKLEDPGRPWRRRIAGFVSSRLGERRSFGAIDGFTVVSEALRDRLRPLGKPVLVLLGGVDTSVFRPEIPPPGHAAGAARIRIGYAGSFRAYQGITDLLAAFETLVRRGEPFELVLAGDIDRDPAVLARATAFGDRVTVLGRVPYPEVPGILGRCDVLVVPRRRGRSAHYNYPSKLSEYLALGKPVVVTDVGQAGHVVRHLETGLTVPPRAPDRLAEALLQLRDPDLRARLGRAARVFAEEHLAWPRIAARLTDFLAEAGERRRAAAHTA